MRKGKPPDVWIVPIGLYYTYPRPAWDKLDHLMSQLEHSAGLPPPTPNPKLQKRARKIGTKTASCV